MCSKYHCTGNLCCWSILDGNPLLDPNVKIPLLIPGTNKRLKAASIKADIHIRPRQKKPSPDGWRLAGGWVQQRVNQDRRWAALAFSNALSHLVSAADPTVCIRGALHHKLHSSAFYNVMHRWGCCEVFWDDYFDDLWKQSARTMAVMIVSPVDCDSPSGLTAVVELSAVAYFLWNWWGLLVLGNWIFRILTIEPCTCRCQC